MGNTFQIALDDFDVGQLLDGLSIRAEAWRKTADYMDTGESPAEEFCEPGNAISFLAGSIE